MGVARSGVIGSWHCNLDNQRDFYNPANVYAFVLDDVFFIEKEFTVATDKTSLTMTYLPVAVEENDFFCDLILVFK